MSTFRNVLMLFMFLEARSFNISVGFSDSDLNKCVAEIMEGFPADRSLFMYDEPEFISNALYHSNIPFNVLNFKNADLYLHNLGVYNSYVFSTNRVKPMETFLEQFYKTRYFKADAMTLIIFSGHEGRIDEMFKMLWKFYLTNVLVISSNTNMYTYYPISKGNCSESPPKFIGLCRNVNVNVHMQLESNHLYFDNCRFRIYATVLPPFVDPRGYEENSGFEMMVLKEIVSRLRLDYVYVKHNYHFWGSKLPNGTYTMILNELYNRKGDIMVGIAPFDIDLIEDFDATFIHCFANMVFYVPIAKPIKPWKNIFYIFDLTVWLCTFSSILLTFAVWTYVKQPKDVLSEFFYLINMLVSAAPSQPSNWKLKAIFSMWAFFSLIMTLSYQTPMVAVLSKPNFEYQIETLEDIIDSRIGLGGYSELRQYFDSENYVYKTIYNRWENCSFMGGDCNNRLFVQQKFAYMRNSRSMNYNLFKNRNLKAAPIKNHRVTMFTTMYLHRGSPFLKRMNQLVIYLFQSGLIFKWDKYDNVKIPSSDYTDIQAKTLKLNHIFGATIFYLIGVSISCIVLLCEYLVNNKHIFNQKKC